MPNSLTFNGIKKPWVIVLSRQKSYSAVREVITQEISGKAGAVVQKIKKGVRVEPVTLFIQASNPDDLKLKSEEFAEWLSTDYAVPLEFDNEKSRTYYALYDGELTPDEIARVAKIDVEFIVPDGYKHGENRTGVFIDDLMTVNNRGTVSAKPIFTATALESSTFLQIVKQTGEYMQIGDPTTTETTVMNPRPVILNDPMEALGDWSETGIIMPDQSTLVGNFLSDGFLFKPANFTQNSGAQPWRGPALRKNLSKPLQDFLIEIVVSFKVGYAAQMGRLEIYLIDTDNKVIGKVAIKNPHPKTTLVNADVMVGPLGDRQLLLQDFHGYRKGSYNDFFGKLTIRRDDIDWWGQVGQRSDDGSYGNRSNIDPWRDFQEKYQTPLAAIQIAAGAYKDYTPADIMYIHNITVRELNQPTINEIPTIAEEGDVFVFNHNNGLITRNGEVIITEKDYASTYYDIDTGMNTFSTFPETSFSTKVDFRQRYN